MANSKIYLKSEAGGTTVVSRDTTATSGNLVLPASGNVTSVDTAVTDNAIARYDGATGKLQNSSATIDDNGNIGSGIQSFNGFGGSGFKNYIINGNFDVWQRGNGPFTGYVYGPDRWVCVAGSHTSSATGSIIGKRINHIINTTAGGVLLYQAVELNLTGYNAPFIIGKTFTISVYYTSTTKIKPSLTFRDGVVGNNQVEIFTTTEYKGGSGDKQVVSWTFTVSATALLTNTCATLSIIGESAATNCYVYNVQLEEGSVATPFEQRPYGLELSLCQRYYEKVDSSRCNIPVYGTGNGFIGSVKYKVPKRTVPTISLGTPSHWRTLIIYHGGVLSTLNVHDITAYSFEIAGTSSVGNITEGYAGKIQVGDTFTDNGTDGIFVSAEL